MATMTRMSISTEHLHLPCVVALYFKGQTTSKYVFICKNRFLIYLFDVDKSAAAPPKPHHQHLHSLDQSGLRKINVAGCAGWAPLLLLLPSTTRFESVL